MRKCGAWSQTAQDRFLDSRYARLGKKLFELFPEFPVTPFLLIPDALRTERCNELNRLRHELLVQIQSISPYTP